MRYATPSRAALAGLLLVLGAAGGCQCGTPCNATTCKAGAVCKNGQCVSNVLPDGGLPVGTCTSDADCAGIQGRTHCDVAHQTCVACNVDVDCPDAQRQVCDPSTHTCTPRPPCHADSDCAALPGTPYCETTTGECVSCTADSQCTGTQQVCDASSNVCRFSPCHVDADCAAWPQTPKCEAISGYCQMCVVDADCGTQGLCQKGTCVPKGQCQVDTDCPAGQRCNLLDIPADCVQCMGDSDCTLGGTCSSGFCISRTSCTGDADCAPLKHCDATSGQCVDCVNDAQCENGQTCRGGVCHDPSTCTDSAPCVAMETCSLGACSNATCTDDGREPNDSPYQASPLVSGTVANAVSCPGTWDWYAVRARTTDGVEVTLGYDPGSGSAQLVAWGGTGTAPVLLGQPVATATGQTLLISRLPVNGPVWIGVRGGNTTLPYTVEATVQPGGLCTDDAYEPNDQPGDAVALPTPVAGTTGLDAVACPGVDDWWSVAVPAGMEVTADAEDAAGGSAAGLVVSLYTLDASGAAQLVAGNGTNVATAPARAGSGTVLVEVVHAGTAGEDYQLTVHLAPPPPPNDTCAGALTLTEGVPVDGTTAGATDDGATKCGGAGSPDVVYGFDLAATRTVDLATTGALDTILGIRTTCDDPTTEVACHDQPGSTEDLHAVLPAGHYTAWVDGYQGRSGSFQITLTTADPPPPPANETCATAAALDPSAGGGTVSGEVATATDDVTASCGNAGGDAIYTLSLALAASLSLDLAGDPGLSVSVRGACADPATETGCAAVTATAAGHLELPDLTAGTWTLVVDGGGPVSDAYTLTWALGSPIPAPTNEDCATAAPLDVSTGSASATGDTRNATDDLAPTCAATPTGGDVVYAVTLAQPASLTASLTASWDAVLDLRPQATCTTDASRLACAAAAPPTIFEPYLDAGTYDLVVDGQAGAAGPFTLQVGTGAPRSVPANDTCAAATVLDVSSGSAQVTGSTYRGTNASDPGSACTGSTTSGPDVFYAVSLAAGQTLSATATPTAPYDTALYLLPSCGATTCLAGSDTSFVSGPESVTYTATTAETVYLVVDGYQAGDAGDFDLSVTVQ